MAVIVTEGNTGLELGKSKDSRTGKRKFCVTGVGTGRVGTKAAETAIDSITGLRIPQVGEEWPDTPGLKVKGYTTNPDGPSAFDVVVNYERDSASGLGGNPDDPLSEPTRWSINAGLENVQIDRDKDGNPIVNGSREGYEPPNTSTKGTCHLSASKNFANLTDLALWNTLLNCTNSDDWVMGLGPGQAKFEGFSVAEFSFPITYVTVTFNFEVAADPIRFKLRNLDQGYRVYDADNDYFDDANKIQYKAIQDADNQPIQKPALLNGKGGKFGTDNGTTIPPGAERELLANAAFLIWTDLDSLPFGVLNL